MLACSHEYGVGNPITDAGSRGQDVVMREIMRHHRIELDLREPTARMHDFMERACDFFESLSSAERRDSLEGGGARAANASAAAGKHSTSVHLKAALAQLSVCEMVSAPVHGRRASTSTCG